MLDVQSEVTNSTFFVLFKAQLLFKDYNKRLVGTTRHSSRVSDITNPKIYINPSQRTRFIDYQNRIC
ncbi:hypothetical protein PO909_018133 [Leuciscus waleckii]